MGVFTVKGTVRKMVATNVYSPIWREGGMLMNEQRAVDLPASGWGTIAACSGNVLRTCSGPLQDVCVASLYVCVYVCVFFLCTAEKKRRKKENRKKRQEEKRKRETEKERGAVPS